MGTANVTLYAQWATSPGATTTTVTTGGGGVAGGGGGGGGYVPPPTYTVTFDSKGGTPVSPITGIAYNATVTLPADPTKALNAFAGWFSDDTTFLVPFTASTPVIADITVYAKWTPTYTVTFDKNGGDTEADPTTKTVIHGGNVGTLPTAPTRTGHIFISWNTETGGGGTEFTATTVVTADITVFAQWEECATVTLGANWEDYYSRHCTDTELYWWYYCGGSTKKRDRVPITVTILEGDKNLDWGTITINIDTDKLAVYYGTTPVSGNIVLDINSLGTGLLYPYYLSVKKAGALGDSGCQDWTDTTDITVVELQDAAPAPVCFNSNSLTIDGDDSPLD